MIPTAPLAGFVAGRWWAVPLIASAWMALVVGFGDCDLSCAPFAASLGAANGAAGVAIHRLVLAVVRSVQRKRGV